jgi:hypothetical protein
LNGKLEENEMHNTGLQPLPELNEPSGIEVISLALTAVAIFAWRRIGLAVGSLMLAIAWCFKKIAEMIRSNEADELLCYVPKRDKVVEGSLLLLQRAAEAGQPLTAAKLVTTMFLADKAHLDAYGRPVFFDNYIAAKDGPEGVAATEMLDANYDWASIGIEIAPWTHQSAGGFSCPQPSRPANMRRLSETDVEALESALAMMMNLDLAQLSLFTHRGQAYVAAWNDGRGKGSRLDPRLIPDERDDEMIDDLLYASRHAFIAPYR